MIATNEQPAAKSSIALNTPAAPDRLVIDPGIEPHQFRIMDRQTGNCLGHITQSPTGLHQVELFWGKGGFMGLITSPLGVKYFVLPGGSVQVQGTAIHLEGSPITSNATKARTAHQPIIPQQHSVQASILGAGLATRFERISGDSTDYSKPAVPVVGHRSVIECIANGLATHGFTHLLVNTYFKPVSLKHNLSRCDAKQVQYIDESEPSGTAGGLRKMLTDPQFAGLLDETKPLLIVQGDSVTDADFSSLMDAHMAHDALVTIGCQPVAEKDVDKFGIIVTDQSGVDGQSGRIIGFQEKPKLEEAKSRLGNTGFYIFSPQSYPIIKAAYEHLLQTTQKTAQANQQPIPAEVAMDFALDVFPAMLKFTQENPSVGAFWAQTVSGYWSDIGNPSQYLETVHDVYAGKVNFPLPENLSDYYRDGVIFWEGAAANADQEGAQLQGNVVVAKPFEEA